MQGSVRRPHGLRREQNLNRIASGSAKTHDILSIIKGSLDEKLPSYEVLKMREMNRE